MEAQVNGEWQEFEDGTTVAGVIEALGAGPKGIAVALDGQVVRRGDWAATVVPAGSRVEILTAVQGG